MALKTCKECGKVFSTANCTCGWRPEIFVHHEPVRIKGNYQPSGWDPKDAYMVRGLLLLTAGGKVWNKAPLEMRDAALKLKHSGWKPKSNLFENEPTYDVLGCAR